MPQHPHPHIVQNIVDDLLLEDSFGFEGLEEMISNVDLVIRFGNEIRDAALLCLGQIDDLTTSNELEQH